MATAGQQGNAGAQLDLGFMYDNGYGVPQDYTEAIKWYRKAAEQGNDRAQYNLGLMYDIGYGVPQDFVRAHMWYDIAGVDVAIYYRDYVAREMTPEQIAEAQKLAGNGWESILSCSRYTRTDAISNRTICGQASSVWLSCVKVLPRFPAVRQSAGSHCCAHNRPVTNRYCPSRLAVRPA